MLTLLYHAYRSLRRVFDIAAHPQQDRDERYLAESTDIYDLERRMRQLDAGGLHGRGFGAASHPGR